MSTHPLKISDYTTLPLSIPPTPTFPTPTTHTLYLRPHTPKIPTPTSSRSLFLCNAPIDSTPTHFRHLFTTLLGAGRFESITFPHSSNPSSTEKDLLTQTTASAPTPKDKKRKRDDEARVTSADIALPSTTDRPLHKTGSTAIITLADTKSIEATLRAIAKLHKTKAYPTWSTPASSSTPSLGSSRYSTHQSLRYPSRTALETSVNAFMSAFNSREETAARAAKARRDIPDEDGFVTVSRGGRTGPARREEAEEARRKEMEKEEAKRESMGDFYRFQGREKRKAEQGELVRRFEEDRKRVEEMRAERRGRFRPE